MEQRGGSVRGLFRIRDGPERGAYSIEGIVAVGVFFLLLLLIVQMGFLVLARSAAGTTVDAVLRRAATSSVGDAPVHATLHRDISAVVPGVEDLSITVESSREAIHAVVRFRWMPPGPNLVPVAVALDRSIVRSVPP